MILRDYQTKLINDTRSAFRSASRPLVVLPCGGGKTVCFADMAHKHIEKNKDNFVWFLVHREELIDQTIQTFNDFNIPLDNIFVGMVQTVSRHLDIERKPTLIIFDEAHHAKAKTWYKIIEYYNDVPTIGLTATPHRYDGLPLGDIFDALISGPETDWLIENKYLSEYDYYAPPVTNLEFKIKGMEYDLDDVAALLLKSKIYADIEKYIDYNRQTIIYAPTINFSKSLCERIGATHFDGNTPKAERKKIVEDFKAGKIKILSNVDLIGEGFDVPDCEVVVLLRPTQSLSLFIQQSMRCLRPGENKRATIYDLVGNVYRHGLPSEPHIWSLSQKQIIRNQSSEPDIICRQCKNCLRVYSGINPICPYCGNDNKQTRKQIEEEREKELIRIEKIQKNQKRVEVGKARDLDSLIKIGRERGYKNPVYWAKMVLSNRKRRI